jgi:ketosteroid isomerase-like protein
MTAPNMPAMVETYFRGVDLRDAEMILSVMTPDCRFHVETHGDAVVGHAAIRAMFEHIWKSPGSVIHDTFIHTVDPVAGRVASQFRVIYTRADGSTLIKSNANVFTLQGDRFGDIAVYMAGENRLKPAPAG